jgi:hypothetical protein
MRKHDVFWFLLVLIIGLLAFWGMRILATLDPNH